MRPPQDHSKWRWHWLDTEHGPMCASWFPMLDTWDISGHSFRADDARVKSMAYLTPAIPPSETK